MDEQKFIVEIDGVDSEATIVKTITLDNKEYAIYSVDNRDDASVLFCSEIVQDEEGFDVLIDINDNKIKQKIIELVNSMLA